jgi:pyrroline-5-carboxylate reductase
MSTNPSLTFIGGGNLTSSLVAGILANGYPANLITISSTNVEKLAVLAKTQGVNTSTNNITAVANADIVILAVKPKDIKNVCLQIGAALRPHAPLVISVASGVTMLQIEQWLDFKAAIVRAMPNTPSQVLQGVTGLCANEYVSNEQRARAEALFKAVSLTTWFTKEDLLHAVTALSGSGTAYHLLIIEAMAEAGIELGLSPDVAKLLSIHTGLGAAKLAASTDLSLKELRDQVTSPNGTTAQALRVMEAEDIRGLMRRAMIAAYERSIEMSKEGS